MARKQGRVSTKAKKSKGKEPKVREPHDYTKYTAVLNQAAETYTPYAATTMKNFRSAISEVNEWVKTSTPFRKNPSGTSDEKRVYKLASSLFDAAKTDLKEGYIVSFKNLNAKLEELIGGLGQRSFDESYDAEKESSQGGESQSSFSASFKGVDNETYMAGTAIAAEATVDAVSNATTSIVNAQLTTADYASKRIVSGTNVAVSRVIKNQALNADILNTVNKNMVSLVETVNKSSTYQQQALQFFQRSEESLGTIIQLMKDQADPEAAKRNNASDNSEKDFLTGGFDPGKFVKYIYKNSSVGTLVQSGLAMASPILAGLGVDVKPLLKGTQFEGGGFEFKPLQMIFDKTPLARQLKMLNDELENNFQVFFHNFANNLSFTGNSQLDSFIRMLQSAGLTGDYKIEGAGNIDLSSYDKGVTKIKGTTLRAIDTVIPDYLSNIENDIAALLEGFTTGQFHINSRAEDRLPFDTETQLANADYFNELRSRDRRRVYKFETGSFTDATTLASSLNDQVNAKFYSRFEPIMKELSQYLTYRSDDEWVETNKKLTDLIAEFAHSSEAPTRREDFDKFFTTLFGDDTTEGIGIDVTKFADEKAMFGAFGHMMEEISKNYGLYHQDLNELYKGISLGDSAFTKLMMHDPELKGVWSNDARFKNRYGYRTKDQNPTRIHPANVKGQIATFNDGTYHFQNGQDAWRSKLSSHYQELLNRESNTNDNTRSREFYYLSELFTNYKEEQNPVRREAIKIEFNSALNDYTRKYGDEFPVSLETDSDLDVFSSHAKYDSGMGAKFRVNMATGYQIQRPMNVIRDVAYGRKTAGEALGMARDWFKNKGGKVVGAANSAAPGLMNAVNNGAADLGATIREGFRDTRDAAKVLIGRGPEEVAPIPVEETPEKQKFNLMRALPGIILGGGGLTVLGLIAGNAVSRAKKKNGGLHENEFETEGITVAGTMPEGVMAEATDESDRYAIMTPDGVMANATEAEPNNAAGLHENEFETEGATVYGTENADTNGEGPAIKEVNTGNSSVDLKAFTNDKIRRANAWADQKKEMFAELVANVRRMTGMAEDSRIHLFGPDGILSNSLTKFMQGFKTVESFLFGEKNEEGYYKGGLFSPETANKLVDSRKEIKNRLLGTEYTDFSGNFHEAREDFLLKGFMENLNDTRQGFIESTFGEDYESNDIYQHLPNFLKNAKDRHILLPKLPEYKYDENGKAIDTYDYSKVNPLPYSNAEIIGWKWHEGTKEWRFHYVYNSKEMWDQEAEGYVLDDPTTLPPLVATNLILTKINKYAPLNKVDRSVLDAFMNSGGRKITHDTETAEVGNDTFRVEASGKKFYYDVIMPSGKRIIMIGEYDTQGNSMASRQDALTDLEYDHSEGTSDENITKEWYWNHATKEYELFIKDKRKPHLKRVAKSKSNGKGKKVVVNADGTKSLSTEHDEGVDFDDEGNLLHASFDEDANKFQRAMAKFEQSKFARGMDKLGRGAKMITGIFGAIAGTVIGGPVGAIVGYNVGNGNLVKAGFKFHQGIMGHYADKEEWKKHPFLTPLKNVLKIGATLITTIFGTVAGSLIGGPAGAAIGFALGNTAFKKGGLAGKAKELLFGKKGKDGKKKNKGLIGGALSAVKRLLFGKKREDGTRSVGIVNGLWRLGKKIKKSTPNSGPGGLIGGLVAMSMGGGIPAFILGNTAGRVIGQGMHDFNEGFNEGRDNPVTQDNQENVGNGYGEEVPKNVKVAKPNKDISTRATFDGEVQEENVGMGPENSFQWFDQELEKIRDMKFDTNITSARSIQPTTAISIIPDGMKLGRASASEVADKFNESMEAEIITPEVIGHQGQDIKESIDSGFDRIIDHLSYIDNLGVKRKEKADAIEKERLESEWARSAGKKDDEPSTAARLSYDAEKSEETPQKKTLGETIKEFFSNGGLLDILKVALPVGGAVWLLSSFFKTDVGQALKDKISGIFTGIGTVIDGAKTLLENIAIGADAITNKGIGLGMFGTLKTNISNKNPDGTAKNNFVDDLLGFETKSYIDEQTGEVVTTKTWSPSNISGAVTKGVITGGAQKAIWDVINMVVKKLPEGLRKVLSSIGKWTGAMVSDAVSKVAAQLSKWFPNIAAGVSKGTGKVATYIANNAAKLETKLAQKLPGMTPELLTKVAFASFGAASTATWGVTELFGVELGNVDSKMREVASIFGALCWGTTIGAAADFVAEILKAATGIDLKKALATIIYGIVAGSEKANTLARNQADFQNRLSILNATNESIGAETLSESEFHKETEYGFWDTVGSFWGVKTQHAKEVDATRAYLNAKEVEAMHKEKQYQNRSVEDMSTENEGYGQTAGSVGYGMSNNEHYSQLDTAWKNLSFGKMLSGKSTTIGSGGCGPTALATVARSLTGNRSITPSTVANMAQDYGYTANGGSSASLFTEGASRLGLTSRRISPREIPSSLASGQKIIVSGKKDGNKSPYTRAGHIISLSGVKNGKAVVDDPLKSKTETMNVRDVLSGAKKAWVIGGGRSSVGYGVSPEEYADNLESMGYGWMYNPDGSADEPITVADDQTLVLANPYQAGRDIAMFNLQYPFDDVYSANGAESIWKDRKIDRRSGQSGTFRGGCIPTAYANLMSSLSGVDIDPITLTRLYEFPGGYDWTHYMDMYGLLTGGLEANSDPMAFADALYYHNGDDWYLDDNTTGSDLTKNNLLTMPPRNASAEDAKKHNLEVADRIINTLQMGGGVFVDTHGTPQIANSYNYSSDGHGFALFGWNNDRNTFYTIDSGRSNPSMQVTEHNTDELKYDVLNNNIRNVEGFPRGDGPKLVASRLKEKMHEYVAKYYPTSVNGSTYGYANGLPYRGFDDNSNMTTFIQDENGFTKYDVRPSGMQTAGSGVAGSAASVSTSGPSLNDNTLTTGINGVTATADDYKGYKWADQLDLSDTTFTGKLGNMMQIFNGIANNALESILTGKEYQSVFGFYNGSGGAAAQYDGNLVAGTSHTPKYILVKNGRIKGAEAYVDVGDLDIHDDEVLSSVAMDIVKEFYPDYKKHMEDKGLPPRQSPEENPDAWKADVDAYKTQIKETVRNNQFVDGKYYHVSDADSNETLIIPAWLDKEEITRRLRSEYPIKSYKSSHPDDDDPDAGYSKFINDWYRSSIEGVSTDGRTHPIQLFDSSGLPISQSDIISADKIKLPSGARVIVPSALKGSYASDNASSSMTWDVKVPNGMPLEYAQTGYKMTKVGDGSYDYIDDPGPGFTGDTAYSKISNAYGPAAIPEGWSSIERISLDKFDTNKYDAHTLFRDVRKFPPITADRMNELIPKITNSEVYQGQGQTFIDASNISGIDPRFLLVQSGIESDWGRSDLARKKSNYFGITAYDGSAYSSGTSFTKNGVSDFRTGILNGAQWISRNHINRASGDYIPKAAPALLGWNDGHIYGNGYSSSGIPGRTAYGQGLAATLIKTEGYGEAEGYGDPYANPTFDTSGVQKELMEDKSLNRILGNFDKIDTSADNSSDFAEGFGNISSVNSRDDHSSSNMNINASRSYSPRANITTNDNSRSEIDVNVDLNKLENGTASMIKLLEKIVLNTSKMRNSSTVINNNNYESAGYGNATTKGSEKVQNVTIVNNENSKINNNHTDKMRLIHERIAKSPRNYL